MKILALDSSSKSASAALIEDGKLICESFVNAGLTHSRTLMQMVNDCLKISDTEPSQIEGFALTNGPGSFTGLRIAVSAVKGMAAVNSTPCASVSTLLSLAYNLRGCDGYALALLDARCNQFYYAIFRVCEDKVERICEDSAGNSDDIFQKLDGIDKTIYTIGDGAELFCKSNAERIENKNFILCNDRLRFVNGYSTALAAEEIFTSGRAISADEIKIEYLRLPQAERELKKKKGEEV